MADITNDFGRATRIVVSAYDRARVHGSTLTRGEKRTFVVTVNGAVPAGVTIVSARWQCADACVLVMSNARLVTRSAVVDVLASSWGDGSLKCTLTLSTGEVLVQLAVIRVQDGCFDGPTAAGPTVLSVTA